MRESRGNRATILWQRLDLPGHDTAAFWRAADGWCLWGVALIADAGRPCRIEYEIACDPNWKTRRCSLHGYVGAVAVALQLERSESGTWKVGGAAAPHLDGCDDIDLGFTPATNLLPIRRLDLAVGDEAPVRAAWVKFPELSTEVLDQTYKRLAPDRYLYTSDGGSFRRELVVDTNGFVLDYPELWRAEARAAHD